MTTDQKLDRIDQNLEILTVHVGRLTEGLTEFRADTAEIKEMIRQQIVVNRDLAETVRQQGERQEQASQLFRADLAEIKAMIRENADVVRQQADVVRQQADVVSRLTGIVEQLIQNRS